MKKMILSIIFGITLLIGGCGPATQLVIGGANILLNATAGDSNVAKSFQIPTQGTPINEVIAKCGQPDFVINIDGSKSVLYYDTGTNDTTIMLAIVDGVYQEHYFASTKSVEEYKKRGKLREGAIKIFKSFHEDLASTAGISP